MNCSLHPLANRPTARQRVGRIRRDAYSGVRAVYNNVKTGNRGAVLANISGKAKELRTIYASEADALAAARAEWLGIQRGIFDFEITLAYGRADIIPQRPARVTGYKRQIDETPWIVTLVRHTLDGGGYTSQLTLETEQAEGVEGQEGASVQLTNRVGGHAPCAGGPATWVIDLMPSFIKTELVHRAEP